MSVETTLDPDLQDETTVTSLHTPVSLKRARFKVLHIWNTAGVAGYLADYMKYYYGVNGVVMMRGKYDVYGLNNEYVENYDCGVKEFYVRCWLKGLFYDIIHIHGEDKMLKMFRGTLPYGGKKMIIHYHGTDIRNRWGEKMEMWRCADKVIVSTKDLIDGSPDGTIYLPNVVDEGMMNEINGMDDVRNNIKRGVVFHVHRRKLDALDVANEYVREYGLKPVVFNRDGVILEHKEFLKELVKYEYYVDVKRGEGRVLEALSLTGLEALFMGVKVIRWDGVELSSFPLENKSDNVCDKLMGIYEELVI